MKSGRAAFQCVVCKHWWTPTGQAKTDIEFMACSKRCRKVYIDIIAAQAQEVTHVR